MYQYGWHGLSALKYMIEYEKQQEIYQDYTATMQKHLVDMLGQHFFSEWKPMPSYISMMHPDVTQPVAQETNEDAKAHIYNIFGITPPEGGDV